LSQVALVSHHLGGAANGAWLWNQPCGVLRASVLCSRRQLPPLPLYSPRPSREHVADPAKREVAAPMPVREAGHACSTRPKGEEEGMGCALASSVAHACEGGGVGVASTILPQASLLLPVAGGSGGGAA